MSPDITILFVREIMERQFAKLAGKTPNAVYELWRKYSRLCDLGDQSPVMFEFIAWYANDLGGDRAALQRAIEAEPEPAGPRAEPQPGDRVGIVCGPGEIPRDNAGTVIAVYADEWHASNAVILMDRGQIEYLSGTYTRTGIGCYLIKEGSA